MLPNLQQEQLCHTGGLCSRTPPCAARNGCEPCRVHQRCRLGLVVGRRHFRLRDARALSGRKPEGAAPSPKLDTPQHDEVRYLERPLRLRRPERLLRHRNSRRLGQDVGQGRLGERQDDHGFSSARDHDLGDGRFAPSDETWARAGSPDLCVRGSDRGDGRGCVPPIGLDSRTRHPRRHLVMPEGRAEGRCGSEARVNRGGVAAGRDQRPPRLILYHA